MKAAKLPKAFLLRERGAGAPFRFRVIPNRRARRGCEGPYEAPAVAGTQTGMIELHAPYGRLYAAHALHICTAPVRFRVIPNRRARRGCEGPYEAPAVVRTQTGMFELHAPYASLHTAPALYIDVRSLSRPLPAGAFGMTRFGNIPVYVPAAAGAS